MKDKPILYIAFHYPPILGSSGVLRSLVFTRHLADNGWQTTVLSASLACYETWAEAQFKMLPSNVKVIRAFARDTAKSFSYQGKYSLLMALPDRWQSWLVGGVASGLKYIWKEKPKAIVSTYPIATAHLIALVLHKLTGVVWVGDFRDPMVLDDYPLTPRTRKLYQWIEKKAVEHCAAVVLTSPGAQQMFRARYPEVAPEKFHMIPNGYDEQAFSGLARNIDDNQKLVLLHSGIIYPEDRDPTCLFKALSCLKQANEISATDFELRLRATGNDGLFSQLIAEHGIEDLVTLQPIIPYHDALQEMFNVNGLLLIQAAECNSQIPAKAYEYIRVGHPILGLMPTEGDTGQLIEQVGNNHIAPINDTSKIIATLKEYLKRIKQGQPCQSSTHQIEQYSRQSQAIQFQKIIEQVTSKEQL